MPDPRRPSHTGPHAAAAPAQLDPPSRNQVRIGALQEPRPEQVVKEASDPRPARITDLPDHRTGGECPPPPRRAVPPGAGKPPRTAADTPTAARSHSAWRRPGSGSPRFRRTSPAARTNSPRASRSGESDPPGTSHCVRRRAPSLAYAPRANPARAAAAPSSSNSSLVRENSPCAATGPTVETGAPAGTPFGCPSMPSGVIAAVDVGFAVADGRWRIIAVESSLAASFVALAAAAITGSAWLPIAGLAANGLKDLWQHRTQLTGTR